MGKLQTKLGIASLLSKFSFEFVDKNLMHNEIEFDPKLVTLTPKKGIMTRAVSRK
jgi:hypothetical protein